MAWSFSCHVLFTGISCTPVAASVPWEWQDGIADTDPPICPVLGRFQGWDPPPCPPRPRLPFKGQFFNPPHSLGAGSPARVTQPVVTAPLCLTPSNSHPQPHLTGRCPHGQAFRARGRAKG